DVVDRETYGLSLHDALPISGELLTLDAIGERHGVTRERIRQIEKKALISFREALDVNAAPTKALQTAMSDTQSTSIETQLHSHRSEEHTSELQSRENLVCRL